MSKTVKKTANLKQRKRVSVMLFLFSAVLFLLTVRIGWLQIVRGQELQRMALEQQTKDQFINPKRGKILDRNGRELAISENVETVAIYPKQVRETKNAELIADRLAVILELDRQFVMDRINKNSGYEYAVYPALTLIRLNPFGEN